MFCYTLHIVMYKNLIMLIFNMDCLKNNTEIIQRMKKVQIRSSKQIVLMGNLVTPLPTLHTQSLESLNVKKICCCCNLDNLQCIAYINIILNKGRWFLS